MIFWEKPQQRPPGDGRGEYLLWVCVCAIHTRTHTRARTHTHSHCGAFILDCNMIAQHCFRLLLPPVESWSILSYIVINVEENESISASTLSNSLVIIHSFPKLGVNNVLELC